MGVCEFFEKCPIFKKSEAGRIKGIYIVLYCKGARMEECERRKLKQAGEEPPLSLLPTGNHKMSLTKD